MDAPASISRTYRFGSGKPGRPVHLDVFPAHETEPDCFGCRLRIEGHRDKPFDTTVYGFDGLQATMLALKLAGTELYGAGEAPGPHVFWHEPNDDLDIPVLPTLMDRVLRRNRTLATPNDKV